MTVDVAVVGAGIGGLVAARELAKAGCSVEIHEAAPVVGGLVGALQLGDVSVDSGPESFATRGGAVAELVDELGLERVDPAPLGSWLVFDDGAAPSPAGALMGIPGDVTADDVVRIIGDEASRQALRDFELPAEAGTASGMLGELVRVRLGDRVLERLVDPIVSGVYSKRADDLPAPAHLRAALAEHGSLQAAVLALTHGAKAKPGAQVQGIRGGIHRLAEALAADVRARGGTVRLGSRITDPAALDARVVVLAAPPDDNGAEVELVTLAFERGTIDGAPRGTGALVAASARTIAAKALTHSSRKWPWLYQDAPEFDIVRLSYGRLNQQPPTSCLDDKQSAELAVRDAELILGQTLRTPVFTGRRSLRQPPTPGTAEPATGEFAVGSWIAGTGLASVVPHSIATAKALSPRLTGSTGG